MRRRAAATILFLAASAPLFVRAQQLPFGAGTHEACIGTRRVVRHHDEAPRAMRACSADAECTFIVPACCDGCGASTSDRVRAVSVARRGDYFHRVCAHPTACIECAAISDPNVHTACFHRACEVVVDDPTCAPPGPS